MKRIVAVVICLALSVATPGIASADATHQQAINVVIARALSQRGVPFAYGGGSISGPSLGTASVDNPTDPAVSAVPAADTFGATGLNLAPVAPVAAPAVEPRVSRVGFDASGLVVYAFAGAGI